MTTTRRTSRFPLFILFSLMFNLTASSKSLDTIFVSNNIKEAIRQAKVGKSIFFEFYGENLESLPNDFLEIPSEKLVAFRWDNCKAKDLPTEFSKFKNLSYLELNWFYAEKSKMKLIPPVICNLTGLKKLVIEGIDITTVPVEIKNLVYLETFKLNSSGIKSFPESILTLINLKTLSLACNNGLTSIPDKINMLQKLENLEFEGGACGGAPINYLPESLGDLKNLTSFSLGYSNVEFLPKSFCNLTNLENITLWYSGIKKLPENIGKLTNLKHFTIASRAELEALPESFFTLPLEYFKIVVNPASDGLIKQENNIRAFGRKIKDFKIEESAFQKEDLTLSIESPIIGPWEYITLDEKESPIFGVIVFDSTDYEISGTIIKFSPDDEESMIALYSSDFEGTDVFGGTTKFKATEKNNQISAKLTSSTYVTLDEAVKTQDIFFDFKYSYDHSKKQLTIIDSSGKTFVFKRYKR